MSNNRTYDLPNARPVFEEAAEKLKKPAAVPDIPFNEGLMVNATIGIDEGVAGGDKTVINGQILNG